MAIWQFILNFYPSERITNQLGNIPEQLPKHFLPEHSDLEEDLTMKLWANYDRNYFDRLLVELSEKLPEVEWLKNSTNIFSWGCEDTNDLTICFSENNMVESFGCRIDMRTLDEDFIELVLELCNSKNFLIADRKGNLRTPNRHELRKLMANSNPANFVADPKKFLKDFEGGKRKPDSA